MRKIMFILIAFGNLFLQAEILTFDTYDDWLTQKEAIANAIKQRKSFVLKYGLLRAEPIKKDLEKMFEENGLRSRFYLEDRLGYSVAALLLPPIGLLSIGFIAAHNAATFNPDYEVADDNGKLTITYKH